MGPMKLYRLLRDHITVLNTLTTRIYKEEIPAEEATALAKAEIEKTKTKLDATE